ncbi:MAG: hypothetical protein WBZ29_07535 [Methanocella sp.]
MIRRVIFDQPMSEKKEVTFKVFRDPESGRLCANGVDHGIFTYARTYDRLVRNIRQAVECHFDIPSYKEVDIKIIPVDFSDIEAEGSHDVEASCH